MPNVKVFEKIGVTGKPGSQSASETVSLLCKQLLADGKQVFVPERNQELVDTAEISLVPFKELGTRCDLVIVVGGGFAVAVMIAGQNRTRNASTLGLIP